ncbi:hypothetical protein G436_0421 [Leptospira interrogans serovar Hardjo str. Norma]|uniref:Uncharacterized protein n=1 Tax=Leptospira interrogans serovar Hardjo str. Norma TaxID=1279460 RepID=A0A0M3TKN2_LEPIR|nr:hypothetical protein G436_0421 [Leptospira interrogans serovar Hardjo str. Norma]
MDSIKFTLTASCNKHLITQFYRDQLIEELELQKVISYYLS